MAKKLYEVKVELSAFVLAEDEADAMRLGDRALEDEISSSPVGCEAVLVTHRDWALPGDWEPSGLVYGSTSDTKLGDELAKLPEDPRYARLRELSKKKGE